jgi:hypothetical protein
MSTLKQRIEHYLQEASPSGDLQVSEADYSEYMRERDEIESRRIQKSLKMLQYPRSGSLSRTEQ